MASDDAAATTTGSPFARAQAIVSELRLLRSRIVQISRAVIVSTETVDLRTSGEGSLMINTVLNEAEKVAELIGRMNQLTRELHETKDASGVDMSACYAENEMAAACLTDVLKLIPHAGDDGDDDDEQFIEEFDRLLAQEEEASKRNQYTGRIRAILNLTRSGGARQPGRPVDKDATPTPTAGAASGAGAAAAAAAANAQPNTASRVLRNVVLPLAGGVVGGLIFGPAGLLLGFKGVTMISACAAVGASVGFTTAAGVSMTLAARQGAVGEAPPPASSPELLPAAAPTASVQ